MLFFSSALQRLTSAGRKDFIDDLKYRSDSVRLRAIEQVPEDEIEEPKRVVFEDKDYDSVDSDSTVENKVSEQSGNIGKAFNVLERNETNHERKEQILHNFGRKERASGNVVRHDQQMLNESHTLTDRTVKLMRDQIIRAKVYLSFTPPGSNSHLVKELKTRIKEIERAVGEATNDIDLAKSALQKTKLMEDLLFKASRVYRDCFAIATKLRAMTYNAEELIRAEKIEGSFLLRLAGRTTPKGLHCLMMRLTSEYFSLQPEEREFPNQKKVIDPALYHYVVFSDNVLACAVVVNSTVSSAMEPEKIVIHIVTDSLNLPAISTWFLLNPLGKATIQIQSIDNFKWLSSQNISAMDQQSRDPRYTHLLNHLRFYLPEVFPELNKIVLFDDDVVVQKDLSELWSFDMKGKVNGAVETCQKSEASFRQIHKFINFSDPFVGKRFDVNACTWAFGMNLFNLKEWRRLNLTSLYHKYSEMGLKRPLWKAGSLPLGWVTFYNQTLALDKKWHVVGLGYESGVSQSDIENAAVIHYNGVMKPWLDIAVADYKSYWGKHINYDHSYLQQCNIHE